MRRALLPLVVVLLFAFALASVRRLPTAPAAEPAAFGGPPALADLERCLSAPRFQDRVSCYRPLLESRLQARGPLAVLTELDELQAERASFRAHCHDMVHVLGRSWVARGGSVADGFRAGSNVCHSGFYHGMVERALHGDASLDADPAHASPAELRAKVTAVCTPEALGTESQNFRFQCLHGLGHAILFSLGYDLQASLATCDAFTDSWSRRSCYGGVFMENITGVDRERRDLRAGDPHYPCTAVSAQYRDNCYLMQTSWMRELGMSFQDIARACREAGPQRLACFRSLGRDLSSRVRQDGPAAHVSTCADVQPDERIHCVQGAVFALADHTWDGRYAYPFCAALPTGGSLKADCFRAAHGHLRDALERPVAELAAGCQTFAPGEPACASAL